MNQGKLEVVKQKMARVNINILGISELKSDLHRTGKQTLSGHKQNFVHTRTQEKVALTPQKTDPDLSLSIQESLAKVWVSDGLLQG